MRTYDVVLVRRDEWEQLVARERGAWAAPNALAALIAAATSYHEKLGPNEEVLFLATPAAAEGEAEKILVDIPRPWWSEELRRLEALRTTSPAAEAAFTAQLLAETEAEEAARGGEPHRIDGPQKKGSQKPGG
jgi:hypothetical protein